jgi:hypothetical protein
MAPTDVLSFYVALAVWVTLLGVSLKRQRGWPIFHAFGVLLMLWLNGRYFIDGPERSIAFFVAVYDPLHNLGATNTTAALRPCVDNACSLWKSYQNHASWGVAFYKRFSEGNALRNGLLYGHIAFNTVAFLLMMVQLHLARPGPRAGGLARWHRLFGYASLASLTVGVGCACLLAAEHGPIVQYGGNLSKLGFWFMGLCVYGCALMGIINRRDVQRHSVWMFRYAGAMWGAFWLFRVMEFVLGPLLRGYDTVSILLCVWASAPLGIAIAESIRLRASSSPAVVAKKVE